MSMARDTSKQKTYDAETSAFEDTAFERPVGLWALEQISGLIYKTSWWEKSSLRLTGATIVEAAVTATSSKAVLSANEIRIAYGMDTVATLCHELAHFVCTDGHGPRFRGAVVELIRMVGGDTDAERLESTYRRHGLSLISPTPATAGNLGAFVLDQKPTDEGRHLRRVMALLSKANSTTPEEAELLRAKAFELSARHGISVAHIEAVRKNEEANLVERWIRIGAGGYVTPRYSLLSALATSRCCETMWNNDRLGRVVGVFGHRNDVLEVEMLFSVIDRQARVEMMKVLTKGNTLHYRRAWLAGFVNGVEQSLQREAREQEARYDDSGHKTSTAMVLKERMDQSREFRDQLHPGLRTVRSPYHQGWDAYGQGSEAGAKVSVRQHKAVHSGTKQLGA
jgi:hypothetical protein